MTPAMLRGVLARFSFGQLMELHRMVLQCIASLCERNCGACAHCGQCPAKRGEEPAKKTP